MIIINAHNHLMGLKVELIDRQVTLTQWHHYSKPLLCIYTLDLQRVLEQSKEVKEGFGSMHDRIVVGTVLASLTHAKFWHEERLDEGSVPCQYFENSNKMSEMCKLCAKI